MTIPDSVLKEIRARAKESWPDDETLQESSVNDEIAGYLRLQSFDFSGISENQKEQIIQSAQDIYESWDEIASEVDDEVEALKEMKEFEPTGISNELLTKWKKEAETQHEGCFRLQLEEIEMRVRQHESIQNTRREIDPIKRLLIELEDIVGNECYNSNTQNYSSWGKLESEGRSFRYPVKFSNGKTQYKKWTITDDIPSEELITGYYPFGANELNIYRALRKVLHHLESNYGFRIPKT